MLCHLFNLFYQHYLTNITSASPASSNSNNNTTSNKLEICIKQGIITFVSDELIPFTRLITYNLLITNYNDYAYTNTDIWNISCNTFELWDDTPVGHAYPDIIIPLLSQDDSNNNNINSLMIDVMLPKDYWKYPTQINMQIYDKHQSNMLHRRNISMLYE